MIPAITMSSDGQAAEGEERRLTTIEESLLSSNAFHHSVMC